MTNKEFSDEFTTGLSSYSYPASYGEETSRYDINLDEYEKSVFLTQAQEDVVLELYNGRNHYGLSFEKTEEIRRYLDSLVKTKVYTINDVVTDIPLHGSSMFFRLPSNLAFITLEQIKYDDGSLGCYNGELANVYPVTQDEWAKIRKNPFRGPTKYKAVRLDSGNNIVEIIPKYKIGTYTIRYMEKPTPIILEDLPVGLSIGGYSNEMPCKLNSLLHQTILKQAIIMAAQSKGLKINTK